ncbi:MAG: ABC transporter permease, partial [Bifidobacterium dentium]|nr:ABC transporter permease [Bifidobacterium dentium]
LDESPRHFKIRILLLAFMLTLAGVAFIGIGMFRYTPHPILHNVFARGLPCLMSVLLIGLPWLAPQLSKAVYVVSDLAIAVGAFAGFQWMSGHNTLTNVEALAGLMFLGWFIIFSRQIAAIEADRVQTQLVLAQTSGPKNVEDIVEANAVVPDITSRLASER